MSRVSFTSHAPCLPSQPVRLPSFPEPSPHPVAACCSLTCLRVFPMALCFPPAPFLGLWFLLSAAPYQHTQSTSGSMLISSACILLCLGCMLASSACPLASACCLQSAIPPCMACMALPTIKGCNKPPPPKLDDALVVGTASLLPFFCLQKLDLGPWPRIFRFHPRSDNSSCHQVIHIDRVASCMLLPPQRV